MEKILDLVVSGVKNGDIVVVLVIFVVALLFNAGNILRYFENRRVSRIQFVTESLASPFVTGCTKEFLGRFLEQEYFTMTTGVRLEKEARESLIDLHGKAKGELKFKHFKRAIPYTSYKNGCLNVKIGVLSWIGAFYNLVIGVGSSLLGFILFIIPAFGKPDIPQILSIYGLAAFLVGFGWVMLMQLLPVISARHVEKLIGKLKAEVKTSE